MEKFISSAVHNERQLFNFAMYDIKNMYKILEYIVYQNFYSVNTV